MKKSTDRILYIFEKWVIKIFITLIILFSIYNHITGIYAKKYSLNSINDWFNGSLSGSVVNLQGTLLTIASIFIGIYFSVFTLLTTVNKDSVLAKLSQNNFNKLIYFIVKAFVGSFLYIIISLITSLYYPENVKPNYFLVFLTLISIIYMILSSIRLSIIFYASFKADLKNMHNLIKEEKIKEADKDAILKRMDKFLSEHEEIKIREQAEYINTRKMNKEK